MKNTVMVLLFFVIATTAQLPKFDLQGKIKCNGQNISGIECPTMCVADWDGDGLKDLLVGEFRPSMKVRFYKNSGTNKAPVFQSYNNLKAAGSDIVLSGG